jgi:predicted  nucleic acid-binding Zn-ribbon protein
MNTGPLSTRARLADLALAVYLAPLYEGRRLAVVGPASGEVARRARVLGARTVVSFGGVGDDIAVRALVPGALAALYGKVDVVIVPDAGAVPSLPALLDEARRALGSEGVVVVASEPAEGPVPLERGARASVGFHDLEELCQARFASVRMLGRGPFVGYTLATLDEGSDDVTLDTRLIDGDPPKPEAFIAVASDSEVALDPLAVVQIPDAVLGDVRAAASKGVEEELAKRDQKLKEVEAASAERWVKIQRYEHGLKELEEENRKARDKTVRLSKELEDERKLRQRVELEAQMSRRAPELPKTPDHEPELRRLREAAERSERELTALRALGESTAKELAASKTAAETAAKALASAKAQAESAAKELAASKSQAESLAKELSAARTHAGVASTELASAKTLLESVAAELAASRGQVISSASRVSDLERELDETQSAEAELRTQLDEALERAEVVDLKPEVERLEKSQSSLRAELATVRAALDASKAEVAHLKEHTPVDGEHERLERALAQHSAELTRVRGERTQLEQAVRELTLSLSEAHRSDRAEEVVELRSRLSAMASVHGALVDRAEGLLAENAALREAMARVESQSVAVAGELQQARWRVAELERATPSAPSDELLAAVEAQRQEAQEARDEASRVYATNVALEARLVHTTVELEGARAGYARRVAELERELDRLVKALEVSAAQTAFERDATVVAFERDLHLVRAERDGMSYRVAEAERAIVDAARRVAPAVDAELVTALRNENAALATQLVDAERALDELRALPRAAVVLDEPDDAASLMTHTRLDQVLADMSATAERLARTEEELARVRADLAASRAEMEGAMSAEELVELRAEIDGLVRRCEDLTRDRERRVSDIEALLLQLAERDQRLLALERRREDELMGAQRLIMMEAQANRSLRTSLEDVRAGLSSILVDGRGAMVAHDLMTLLRRIEDAG